MRLYISLIALADGIPRNRAKKFYTKRLGGFQASQVLYIVVVVLDKYDNKWLKYDVFPVVL